MSIIIEKTYDFLDTLESSDLIKNITKYKNRLLKDQKILSDIKKTKKETNPDKLIELRKNIYQNDDYKMYMHYYQELSYIILKINEKYKEYTNTKYHCKED